VRFKEIGIFGKESRVKGEPLPHHPFRRWFITGLVALFPIFVTIFVISLAWKMLLQPISAPVTAVVSGTLLRWFPGLPPTLVEAIGLATAVLLFLAVVVGLGYAIVGLFGARFQVWMDRFFTSLPVIKFIYPHAKQLSDFLFGQSKLKFNRVVAVEYPRKGMYTIGFVTSGGIEKISLRHGHRMLAIFVPTSPTPFTGWTVLVDEREVLPVDMTVDQAVRYMLSGGVIVPPEAPTSLLPAVKPELRPPDLPLDTNEG